MKLRYGSKAWKNLAFKDAMFSKEFTSRVKLAERYREYRSQSTLGFCASLRHAHAERIVVPYLTVGIERYGRLAAYCGVEARQPYLDKRMIEFCLSLPWEQKARNGWSKFCLRNVLERVAPSEVAWRPGWEQISWKFSNAWALLNKANNMALLSSNRTKLKKILDLKKFDEVFRKYEQGDSHATYDIYNLVCLIQWMERNQFELTEL